MPGRAFEFVEGGVHDRVTVWRTRAAGDVGEDFEQQFGGQRSRWRIVDAVAFGRWLRGKKEVEPSSGCHYNKREQQRERRQTG